METIINLRIHLLIPNVYFLFGQSILIALRVVFRYLSMYKIFKNAMNGRLIGQVLCITLN